jgi:hypothetical protein
MVFGAAEAAAPRRGIFVAQFNRGMLEHIGMKMLSRLDGSVEFPRRQAAMARGRGANWHIRQIA